MSKTRRRRPPQPPYVPPQPLPFAPPPQHAQQSPAYLPNATVLQDKNATVAKVTFLKTDWVKPSWLFEATGSAKREQGDPHDPETGELLALARALCNLAEQFRSSASKRVAQTTRELEEAARAREEKARNNLLSALGEAPPRRTREEWEDMCRQREARESAISDCTIMEELGRKGGSLTLPDGRCIVIEDEFVVLYTSEQDEPVRLVKL